MRGGPWRGGMGPWQGGMGPYGGMGYGGQPMGSGCESSWDEWGSMQGGMGPWSGGMGPWCGWRKGLKKRMKAEQRGRQARQMQQQDQLINRMTKVIEAMEQELHIQPPQATDTSTSEGSSSNPINLSSGDTEATSNTSGTQSPLPGQNQEALRKKRMERLQLTLKWMHEKQKQGRSMSPGPGPGMRGMGPETMDTDGELWADTEIMDPDYIVNHDFPGTYRPSQASQGPAKVIVCGPPPGMRRGVRCGTRPGPPGQGAKMASDPGSMNIPTSAPPRQVIRCGSFPQMGPHGDPWGMWQMHPGAGRGNMHPGMRGRGRGRGHHNAHIKIEQAAGPPSAKSHSNTESEPVLVIDESGSGVGEALGDWEVLQRDVRDLETNPTEKKDE